ncbi:RNA polymerase II-associated factor 1 homolog [Condylostylus longicornis]|uniref:RNA polymerase II-associated factor 1 homolog n=1 Tax=Condylostylus longicornis TaxID=2530218 RepID=UPI00244DF4F0|nr:RNA polymerase II-associated factor 1 homolog [Condylostylus longicornis]
MAPTIINGANNADKRAPKPVEKRSELICRVKYSNTLPDIPFDLKFLMYPFENDRFIQYNPTSLERNYKYEVLTEHDLGVTIDLINRDLYQADPYAQLDPDDEKLLEEDVHTPQDSNRSRQHSRSVSWLRKSEYISTEQTRFQPQNLETIEAKVGYNVKKSLREETLYLDRDAQIKAIEKTFEDSKKDIVRHYSKPNVVPVEVLPIYPDFSNWKYPCAQVIFDSDPAPIGKNVPAQIEEMSQAMIRGVMDESGEQFVAYFLPTEETLEKRRTDLINQVLYEDDEEYEYKIAREYNWNVKNKASKGYEENYFFVVRQDGVFYNELETRVRLSKRRVKAGQQPSNTKLVVKHRPLDANEHKMQRYREKQLEPPGEEDEEEEDEDMEIDEEPQEMHGDEANVDTDAKFEDENQNENSDEQSDNENQKQRDRKSRSRSKHSRRSESKARSSRSRSGSESDASGSVSDKSRSRSRSHNKSSPRSRSASGDSHSSQSAAESKSPKSKNGSPARVSKSKSRSKSRASRSRSRSSSASSRSSGSGSRDTDKSGTSSKASSRRSSKSGSESPKSGSDSPKSRSGSSRSRSGSPKSGSGSPGSSPKSTSKSPRSRSGSHDSQSGSGSDDE